MVTRCGGWPTDGWSGCVMSEPSRQPESNRHDVRASERDAEKVHSLACTYTSHSE
ncbi:hypothetical protein CGRA01v4_05274 [Colletotrichum graminicola]|nr:hypothetical protein CGRA01v4_05274 [Colletotrichum graminicola]